MIYLGTYRHHKGGRYLAIAVAETHNHNGDLDVVYISLAQGKHCTRPMQRDSRDEDSWTDLVTWPDGVVRARFIRDDHERLEFFTNMFKEKQPDGS
jgi:hypothetical protein